MTAVKVDNITKCKHADCVLNVWRAGKDCCYFHEEMLTREVIRSKFLLSYIESACNPDGPVGTMAEPDLLLISGIAFESHDLDYLRNNIKRPIVFSLCDFNSPNFFIGQKFGASVHLEKCHLSFDRDSPDIFHKCRFFGKVQVVSLVDEVRFHNCVFADHVVLLNENIAGTCPRLKIVDCDFVGGEHGAEVVCKGDLDLESSEIKKTLTVNAGTSVTCKSLQIHSPSMIKIPQARFLKLHGLRLYSELFIQGGNESSRSLDLCIDDLVWFAGGRIHFNNMHLGSFESRSYRFENASIFDCQFAPLRNRVGFKFERDWHKFPQTAHPKPGESVESPPDHKLPSIDRLELLRDCYRNLKIRFDLSANYPMANNFHAGELWAQWRLNTYDPKKWRGVLNRFISWRALYNWMSAFGQSWVRPLVWLVVSLVVACLLYAAVGVCPEGAWKPEYAETGERFHLGFVLALRRFAFWFRSDGLTPLTPRYWTGWFVAFAQTSITLIAAAFFLLALRRRFKR